MTVYEAKNPHHQRVVDTEGLWWLEDAWSHRVAEWFSADKSRFGHLVRSLNNLSQVGVPEFLPSAEWLADACLDAFGLDTAPYSEFSKPLAVAYAAEAAMADEEYLTSTTLGVTAKVIFSLAPLTQDDVAPVAKKSTKSDNYRLEYPQSVAGDHKPRQSHMNGFKEESPSLQGLAANPALPKLSALAHPGAKLNTFRWMFSEGAKPRRPHSHRACIMQALASNYGASIEDLEFFLKILDREKKRWEKAYKANKYKGSNDHFYGFDGSLSKFEIDSLFSLIGVHPNFVSWPSVDAMYQNLPGIGARIGRSTGVAATWGRDNNLSASQRDRYLLACTYPTEALDPKIQKHATCALLEDSKTGLIRKLSNRVRKSRTPGIEGSKQVSYLAYHAPLLGAVFADLDRKHGSGDVPLEWVLAI